jgi:copper transport protein
MKRLALLLAGLFGCGFLLAGPAAAHAALVGSDPPDGARLHKAPRAVTLTFDENVGLADIGYLHVTDQSGMRVDQGGAYHPGGAGTKIAENLKHGLGDGTYTASYRVISADSHPVAGSFAFVVGNGPLIRSHAGQPSAVDPVTGDAFDVARWISYTGLALLGGLWLAFTVWPAGREDRRARRIVWTGFWALAIGAVLELVLQGPYTAGSGLGHVGSWSLLNDTLHTEYGRLHSFRLLFLGALGLLLARVVQPGERRASGGALAGVLGVAVVWTFSRAGHAATTSPVWFSVAVDMLHLLAMATWIGGLVMIVVAVLPRGDAAEVRRVLPVFSLVAMGAVAVLVGSGTYSAWRGIGSLDAVFGTTYGLLVISKVALLAGILVVANLSRRLVNRRIVAFAMTDAVTEAPAELTDDEIDRERLRRSVAVETVIAFVVLGVTSVLVSEPRGAEELLASYRTPVTAAAPLGHRSTLQVTTSTGVHGPVAFSVVVAHGRAPKAVTATATESDQQLGPLPIKLTKDGSRTFDGSVRLPVAGVWQLHFVVTYSALQATTTDTTIRLH